MPWAAHQPGYYGEDVSHVVLAQAIYGKPVDDTMVVTTSLDQKSTTNGYSLQNTE